MQITATTSYSVTESVVYRVTLRVCSYHDNLDNSSLQTYSETIIIITIIVTIIVHYYSAL